MKIPVNMRPKWKHDCAKCRYLGSTLFTSEVKDWYVCGDEAHKTVIARHGDDGPEYWSVPTEVLAYGDVVRMLDDSFAYNAMMMVARAMLAKEQV